MKQSGRKRNIWAAALGIPLLLAAAYPLQRRIDARVGTVQQERDELMLRSGRVLKKLSLGYDSLLADIYWTRAVQYYGGKRRDHDPNFELLAPLLDLTTTLDPHLLVAYKFGAIFLAEPPPKGAGRPDLAVNLIRRAIMNNPEDWRLWADLGFIYYWDMKDYKKAAEVYLEGGRRPGAREWMKVMAAKIAEEGGSRRTSRFLWEQIYFSTQDRDIRRNALEHLQSLTAEEDAEHLEELAAQFHQRFGRFPASARELVEAGILPGVPVDPAGYSYVLTPDGNAHLNPSSPITSDILKPVLPR
jgi:tetratricopeptide (TPR) repeat protein